MSRIALALSVVVFITSGAAAKDLLPIPAKLVVLTFDDSVKSHYTVARRILKQYKFGATFFITEGFDFHKDKKNYMTWKEIAELHKDGFEIGNHTRDHVGVSEKTLAKLPEQLEAIARQCKKHGIPKPTSFAYPGNAIHPDGLAILAKHGIRFARRGGAPEFDYDSGRGFAYEPGFDHPLLVPSAGDARPKWTLKQLIAAVKQAQRGRVAVLQFHGVPDYAHPWVNTNRDMFAAFMKYLAINKYKVIAMRDLAKYVDPDKHVPRDPYFVIGDRKSFIKAKTVAVNYRIPKNDQSLRYWLTNMIVDHRFTTTEVAAATGLSEVKIRLERRRLKLDQVRPRQSHPSRLKILPFPGGRHPRIGFRDGAFRPQRETKFSVFAPWSGGGYVVVDAPEAIWVGKGKSRQLLYLAHTHVDTMWSKRGIQLDKLEWQRKDSGLFVKRKLPNQVDFSASVDVRPEGVFIDLALTNRSKEVLTGLIVQNCVMLADLYGSGKNRHGFRRQSNDNKVIKKPFMACHDGSKSKWVITSWTPNYRTWGSQHCPCMHSDPQFPDCKPGETQHVKGWVGFYQGTDIDDQLERLRKVLK